MLLPRFPPKNSSQAATSLKYTASCELFTVSSLKLFFYLIVLIEFNFFRF